MWAISCSRNGSACHRQTLPSNRLEGNFHSVHAIDPPAAPADPQLKREPLPAQLCKEHGEPDLASAAEKLRAASIIESIPDAAPPPAAAARPAELRGGQGDETSAAPAATGKTETDPKTGEQPTGQQPAETPGVSAAHVHQQVASAFQQPNPNPFSSAFAYTERMNSAFD